MNEELSEAQMFWMTLSMFNAGEKVSAATLQHKWRLNYVKARRILDALEVAGYIEPQQSESGTTARITRPAAEGREEALRVLLKDYMHEGDIEDAVKGALMDLEGFRGERDEARAQLATLTRQLAEERGRLDWYEKNWEKVCESIAQPGFKWWDDTAKRWQLAPDLRAAIAAARAQTEAMAHHIPAAHSIAETQGKEGL
jgi:DNA-binding PadR family transcriptional regulator